MNTQLIKLKLIIIVINNYLKLFNNLSKKVE